MSRNGIDPSTQLEPSSSQRPTPTEEPTVQLAGAFPVRGSQPTAPAATPLPVPRTARLPVIPGYEVLGELGRGGMGVVYRAKQLKLNRLVALKMLLLGDFANKGDVARFHSEAEAVAAVRHPNIVQVYDYGQHDGRPYFAMEFLTGGNLYGKLKFSAPFPPDKAAELVEKLARGIHAAHSQGIVHRDLKPGNVLFDANGEPRVTDFGLAKRTTCELTRTQAVMGTPAYMPPEQAAGRAKFVGPAADIYALGVILYECLVGKPPFQNDDSIGLMNQVIHDSPPSVRSQAPSTPQDLELICLKCLEKEPDARYATAERLADDLRHYLNAEPIDVRPTGLIERGVKWARRRPTLAAAYGLAALVAFLTVFGGAVLLLWWQAVQARDAADAHLLAAEVARDQLARTNAEVEQAHLEEAKQRALAEKTRDQFQHQKKQVEQALTGETAAKRVAELAREESERIRYFGNTALAYNELNDGNYLRAITLLNDCPAERRGWEWWHICRAAHPAKGSGQCKGDIPLDVTFAPTGNGVMTSHVTSKLTRFDFNTGLGPMETITPVEGSVSLSADGKRAFIGRDWANAWPDAVTVWDLTTKKRLGGWAGTTETRVMHALAPTGNRVAFQYSGQPIRVYDVDSGKDLPIVKADVPAFSRGQFSADGKTAITPTATGAIVWEVDTGKVFQTIPNDHGRIRTVHLSPDGKTAVTGSDTGEVRFHPMTGEKSVGVRRAHVGPITALAVAPSGKLVVTAGEDGAIRIWNIGSGQMTREFYGHLGEVRGLNFHKDGGVVVACDASGEFRVWPVYERPTAVVRYPMGEHMASAFATDREVWRVFASDGRDRGVVWDVRENREYPIYAPPGSKFTAAAMRTDAKSHVVGTDRGRLFLCPDHTSTPKPLYDMPAPVGTLRYSADERRLLAACDRECVVWDTDSWEMVFRGQIACSGQGVAVSTTGRWLAYFVHHTLMVIDTHNRRSYQLHHDDLPSAVDFSRDEKNLLIGTRRWTVNRYDLEKVQARVKPLMPERQYFGHSAAITAFGVSPDGKRLAAGAADGTVRVWDFDSALVAIGLTTDRKKRIPVSSVWFTDDGNGLVAQPEDGPPVAFDGAPVKLK